jgi:hypothetical protein
MVVKQAAEISSRIRKMALHFSDQPKLVSGIQSPETGDQPVSDDGSDLAFVVRIKRDIPRVLFVIVCASDERIEQRDKNVLRMETSGSRVGDSRSLDHEAAPRRQRQFQFSARPESDGFLAEGKIAAVAIGDECP